MNQFEEHPFDALEAVLGQLLAIHGSVNAFVAENTNFTQENKETVSRGLNALIWDMVRRLQIVRKSLEGRS